MFHYAPIDRLEAICREGLKLNSPPTLIRNHEYHKRFGVKPLWLTNDPAHMIGHMILSPERFALLQIRRPVYVRPENEFYKTSKFVLQHVTKTFVCFENIEPQYIEIL